MSRLLTDLARQTKCSPQEVVDNVLDYVKEGLLIKIEWMKTLFDITKFDDGHLSLMYRALTKKLELGGLNSTVEKSYYEVEEFIKGKYL